MRIYWVDQKVHLVFFHKREDTFFIFSRNFIDLGILSMSATYRVVECWFFSASVSIWSLSTSPGPPDRGASLSSEKSPARSFVNHFRHIQSVIAHSLYTEQIFFCVSQLGLFYFILLLKDFIDFSLEREKGGKRGRETSMCGCLSCMPTGDMSHKPGMCPDRESNQWPLGSRPALNPLSHTSQDIFFLRFYLFNFRERGWEVEREGEKLQCVVASRKPHTGDLACNPGMCPDWEPNLQPYGLQACVSCIFTVLEIIKHNVSKMLSVFFHLQY